MIEFMPEYYKSHRLFRQCIEFFENRELGLSLQFLIERADETGHYFPDDFWLGLADAAEQMKMKELASYCSQQIVRNLKELKSKVPFGQTIAKIDDTYYEHYISEKLKSEWVAERRKKDNVESLIFIDGVHLNFIDGVHLKSHGRGGFIYYVEKGRIAEIEYELGIKGFIIWFESTNNGCFPIKQKLTTEDKQQIKYAITDWADKTKNEIIFE